MAEERGWKEQLLDQLMSMATRRLRTACQAAATGGRLRQCQRHRTERRRGIDGLGVYRLGLVSFPVFFQCKRYRGSVRPNAVRDFRGAMAGRGDKAC